MSKKIKENIIVNGKIFNSIKAFCEEYGFKYGTVMYRLKNGQSYEKIIIDLQKDVRVQDKKIEFTIDGVEYQSKDDAIKAYNVPYATVMERMAKDKSSFENALVRTKVLLDNSKYLSIDFNLQNLIPIDIAKFDDEANDKITSENAKEVISFARGEGYATETFTDNEDKIFVKLIKKIGGTDLDIDVYVVLPNYGCISLFIPDCKVITNSDLITYANCNFAFGKYFYNTKQNKYCALYSVLIKQPINIEVLFDLLRLLLAEIEILADYM